MDALGGAGRGRSSRRSMALALGIGILAAISVYFIFASSERPESSADRERIAEWTERLQGDPLDGEARRNLASHYYMLGLLLVQRDLPADDFSSDSALLAHFEGKLDSWEEMGEDVTELRSLLRNDYDAFRTAFIEREARLARDVFGRSVRLYRQEEALGGRLSPADLYAVGTSYFYMGEPYYRYAAVYLERSVRNGLVSSRAFTFLGNISVLGGRTEEGISWYREALDYSPEDPVIAFNLGLAYEKLGRPDPAIEYLRACLNLFSEEESIEEGEITLVLQAHLALGACYLRRNEPGAAAREFETVMEGDPDSLEGHYWLALAYLAEGRTAAARVHLREVVRRDPGFRNGEAAERLEAMEEG